MKFCIGFVSNSSSSSFTINLKRLSAVQLYSILNNEDNDSWSVDVSDDNGRKVVRGRTSMDNYNFIEYLINIGIPESVIERGNY